MSSNMEYLRETWEVLREVYLSQGEDLLALVAEADALLDDNEKQLHAPDTFQHEWEDIQRRLKKQSNTTMTAQGGMPAAPLMGWVEFARGEANARRAKIGKTLRGPRGMLYAGFLLFAQGPTKDWKLASVQSMRPDVRTVFGSEVVDAIESKLVEHRIRQLAAATMRVVENYYKPLMMIVWTLTARVVNYTGKMPLMCGQLMSECKAMWQRIPEMAPGVASIIPIPDFLDADAVQVRNGAAHPAKTRFDVATSELVIDEKGTELRFSEAELRRRLHALLVRCTTMDYSMQWAACELPSDVIRAPAAPDPGEDPTPGLSDTPTKCPVRRNHEKVHADAVADGIDPEILRSSDIGLCNWTGMTAEEKHEAMSEPYSACANPAHRKFLGRGRRK